MSNITSLTNINILLVEDDIEIMKTYTRYLTQQGGVVHQACGGAQAIQMLQQMRVRPLILLDIGMPGMSGYDFLAYIRKNHATEELPVIILTNTTLDIKSVQYQNIKELGVSGVYSKYEIALKSLQSFILDVYNSTESIQAKI